MPVHRPAYDASKAAAANGWDVALPPKDRADVEQAMKNKMPPKYATQIKLHYENLQGAKAE